MDSFSTMNVENLTGQLLVSTPNTNLGSPMHNSLIYIAKHDVQGSIGLIINQPVMNLTLSVLFSHFGIHPENANALNKKIYFGGPLDTERGFVLHSMDYMKRPIYKIDEQNLALSSDVEILFDIAKGRGPQESFMTLGYSGWYPGQLEQEIINNHWVNLPFSKEFIFNEHQQNKWLHAYDTLGIDPARISPLVGNA